MSGLFRSEDMTYVQVLMTDDASHDTVAALGRFGKFHFVDLNRDNAVVGDMQRHFRKRVMDCSAWERKLHKYLQVMAQHNIPIPGPTTPHSRLQTETLLDSLQSFYGEKETQLQTHLDAAKDMRELNNQSTEHQHVLRVALGVLNDQGEAINNYSPSGNYGSTSRNGGDTLRTSLLGDAKDDAPGVSGENKVAVRLYGVLEDSKMPMFRRVLLRLSRGNILPRFYSIEEELPDGTGKPVPKSVFILYLVGETLRARVSKFCQAISAAVYPVPSGEQAIRTQLDQLRGDISMREDVIYKTENAAAAVLTDMAWGDASSAASVAGNPGDVTVTWGSLGEEKDSISRDDAFDGRESVLLNFLCALKQEIAICDVLKQCSFQGRSVRAEGWVPSEYYTQLQEAAAEAVAGSSKAPPVVRELNASDDPPTLFKTNKVTEVFQKIVDTYGVAKYKEVNPGLFTVMTFPFLFGVMYGDVFHGACLALFGLFMILRERHFLEQKRLGKMGEIFGMTFGGRYLIFMMGLFGCYCGSIYNDCASIPLAMFESNWKYVNGTDMAVMAHDRVYPYGIDYRWAHTKNQLAFYNSLKMKLSVTIGVIHMTFGIMLSLANHLRRGDGLSIVFEFIPRMVFMMCTFGYMIFIIIFKMCHEWTDRYPNLIQTMIKMFLSPGTVEADAKLYDGQGGVQAVLLVLAFIAVPMMLFPQPWILHKRAQAAKRATRYMGGEGGDLEGSLLDEQESDAKSLGDEAQGGTYHNDGLELSEVASSYGSINGLEDGAGAPAPVAHHDGGHGDHHDESFGDRMIHQGIHTIEFVLGCVSNTASYLRLWALSLAHAELAEVFWNKLMFQYGMKINSPIAVFIGVAGWAGATFGVLLCMDSLECFLHALRLHWVEFQNKFYAGSGYQFVAFSTEKVEKVHEDVRSAASSRKSD